MSDRVRASFPAAGPDAARTPTTMPSVRPAIELIKIGRRDPKADGWLIRDVSFAINFGDRLGLLGPSGAGKTVLLRAIALLDPLDCGKVLWQHHPVHGEAVPTYRKQVIYLHQRPALLEGSVEDNLRFPFSLKTHRDKAFDRGRAVDLLTALGRDTAFLDKSSRDLSGGESQIVALVRAVQLDPAVLLFDEPTASLDPATAGAVEAIVEAWLAERASDRALVWVSHDRSQTLRVTGRTIALRSGSIELEP
jgi:putative ABC transport system ATP-binding protein